MKKHPFRIYRKKHKLTQGELGEMLAVSQSLVSHIETGRRRIDADRLIEFEGVLGVPRQELRPDLYPS